MAFLTPRQRQVLDYIAECCAQGGVPPTLQEIADAFGFTSTATAQKHVNILVGKKLLVRVKHQRRGLELTAEGRRMAGASGGSDEASTELPLLGTIAAGAPIEAIQQDEHVAVPSAGLGMGPHFALRVRGDSMREEGILDGDLVVVRQAQTAREGETVVALIGEDATLKTYRRIDRERVGLEPANPDYQTLVVPASDLTIQGVVVALLRRY